MTDDANAENDEKATTGERRLERAANRRDLDADALERAHSDAQFTLEKTLRSFSDLSGKAFRLIRLNALVLTILVAIASQVSVGRYVNVASVVSLLLFFWSSLSALVAYLRRRSTGDSTKPHSRHLSGTSCAERSISAGYLRAAIRSGSRTEPRK